MWKLNAIRDKIYIRFVKAIFMFGSDKNIFALIKKYK